MNQTISQRSTCRPPRLVASGLVLSGVVVLAAALAAIVAHDRSGFDGVTAVVIAAGVCWASSLAALLMTSQFVGTAVAIHGLLLSIVLRTGVPLIAAFGLSHASRGLAQAGVFGWIVVFYLVTLAVETWLSVKFVQRARKESEVS